MCDDCVHNVCFQLALYHAGASLFSTCSMPNVGTDVAGGYSCSILDAMRQARIASQVIIFQKSSHSATADQDSKDPDAQPESSFTVAELMYLATVGGAKAMGLEVCSRICTLSAIPLLLYF